MKPVQNKDDVMSVMQNKILLILDLDETLIHSTMSDIGLEPDFKVFDYNVHKRPYVANFLNNISTDFYLAIWSTASEAYVEKVLSAIVPIGIRFEFIWGVNKATHKRVVKTNKLSNSNAVEYHYLKRLKKVKSLGFRLEKMLMVDDSPLKLIENYGNAIYIKEFKGEPNDNELYYLEKYLKSIKDSENVRLFEKRNWRNDIQNIDHI